MQRLYYYECATCGEEKEGFPYVIINSGNYSKLCSDNCCNRFCKKKRNEIKYLYPIDIDKLNGSFLEEFKE